MVCTGDYQLSIMFNGQSIPDSPFDVYVAPSGADSTRLDVTDLDKEILQVGLSCAKLNGDFYTLCEGLPDKGLYGTDSPQVWWPFQSFYHELKILVEY